MLCCIPDSFLLNLTNQSLASRSVHSSFTEARAKEFVSSISAYKKVETNEDKIAAVLALIAYKLALGNENSRLNEIVKTL